MAIYICKKCKREFITFQVEDSPEKGALCPDCRAKEMMGEGKQDFCEFDMRNLNTHAGGQNNACK